MAHLAIRTLVQTETWRAAINRAQAAGNACDSRQHENMSEDSDNRKLQAAQRHLAPVSGLDGACENTDKEIWRKKEGDYYSPSVHVTKMGGVGINVGGHVIVMPVEKWHALGRLRCALDDVR